MSFSDIAGTDTFMPGSERPLLSLTGPPSVTRQTTSHALDGGDAQADLAVVDEQPVVGAGVVGEALVGGGDAVVGARHVVDGDPHLLAGAPLHRARRREPPEADLRALQVGEDADGAALGVGGVRGPCRRPACGPRGRRG